MAKKDKPKTLTPKLRFPEFRDARGWRLAKAHDIVEVLQGYGFPDRYQGKTDGEFPFYKVSDISACVDAGNVLLGDANNHVDDQILKALRAKPISAGATVFAKIGEAIRSNKRAVTTRPCLIDNNAAGVKAISRTADDGFVYYLWCMVPLIDYAGGVVPAVNKSTIEQIPICYPEIVEQRKIAACLTSLDELLAAEGRKLEALRTHKQGLMQQLFPREGESRPRLRFPEFRDKLEWQDTRLGRLGKLVSGLTYSPADVQSDGLLVLRSSNIQGGQIAMDDCVYVRPDIRGANRTQPNDILICVRNGSKPLIGKNALIPDGMPLCTHGAFMTVLRATAPQFVFQLLQTGAYQKQVAADLGATINSINGRQLLKYRFVAPMRAEQQRIAACLSSLDALIAAQSRKLDALRVHKKGLMQQLFPSPC